MLIGLTLLILRGSTRFLKVSFGYVGFELQWGWSLKKMRCYVPLYIVVADVYVLPHGLISCCGTLSVYVCVSGALLFSCESMYDLCTRRRILDHKQHCLGSQEEIRKQKRVLEGACIHETINRIEQNKTFQARLWKGTEYRESCRSRPTYTLSM